MFQINFTYSVARLLSYFYLFTIVVVESSEPLSDEVRELKVKRRVLETDAEALSASADDFADQAEKLQKLPLLAKKQTACDEQQERKQSN